MVALEVVFEEGEMGEMAADDDDDRSVFEVVVVVVSVLPSPSLLLVSLLVVLLDCIGTTEGLTCSEPVGCIFFCLSYPVVFLEYIF